MLVNYRRELVEHPLVRFAEPIPQSLQKKKKGLGRSVELEVVRMS